MKEASAMKHRKSFILYYLICYLIPFLLYFQQLDNSSAANSATVIKTTDRIQHTSTTCPTGLSYRHFYQHIAHLLGWVLAPKLLCKGFFKEPLTLIGNPHPALVTKETACVSSKGPSIITAKGVSILQKDVVVTQPGRMVNADKAYIYRDEKTGRLIKIILTGHIDLHEVGKRIVADKGTLTLYPNKTVILMNAIYHIYEDKFHSCTFKHHLDFNAWGVTQYAESDVSNVINLQHATYSTCNPKAPAWMMSMTTLILNRNTHRGEAYNMLFHIGGIPVFYFPYFNFPIDNYRKTGFLMPYTGHSSSSGWFFIFPFYWNIASNYDLTLTPKIMSKRGLNIQTIFRFLNAKSNGNIYLSYLPNEKVFEQFRKMTLNKFTPSILAKLPIFIPYIDQLKKIKKQRTFFSIDETTCFNSKWSLHFMINYVTDPYFFQDLGQQPGSSSSMANQLLNQIDLKYSGVHWHFTGMLQSYQTLHLINQITPTPLDQYSRLPNFNINGYYPDIAHNINFNFNAEAINFDYHSDFIPDKPRGQRFHTRSSISFPIYFVSGYFIPQIWADATAYNVTHFQKRQAYYISTRLLPIFDIDSGFYLDRSFCLGHRTFIQTLESRFFYLYVPYQNQDCFPNFDTVLLPFSFQELFALNQFTGDDRFQNANQASFALISQILDTKNNNTILTVNIGFIYYLENQKVYLEPVCIHPNYRFSPIVSELILYPISHWFFTGSLAWDPNVGKTNNTSVHLNYNDGEKKAGIYYIFAYRNENSIIVPSSVILSGKAYNNKNTNQLAVTGAWSLFKQWSATGYLDYNITKNLTDIYSIGVQYNACCWTIDISIRYTYEGLVPYPTGSLYKQYDTTFGFEFHLNGLG